MPDQTPTFLPEEMQSKAVILHNVGNDIASECRDVGIMMLRRAITTNPYVTHYRQNLAAHLAYSGEIEEPKRLLDGILLEQPKNPNAWDLRAFLATLEGDLDESISCARRALELAPNEGKYKFNLACSLLRAGNFEEGWPLYEARTEIDFCPPPPGLPQWDGKPCRHLLVYGDQGVGDKIQFARFLPWARSLCSENMTLMVDHNSMMLLFGYRQICDVVGGLIDFSKCDACIGMSSLPLMFGAHLGNIPRDPGLIEVPDVRGALIADGLKIGIAWAGNPRQVNNFTRSMPFTDMLSIATNPRNDIFSLQVGQRSRDIAQNNAQLICSDLSGHLIGNWSSAPTVFKSMDLIVTVCTATAHLAGALGIPTFLVLSRFSCWRWLWGRSDTPWYPSVKIFRQERLHDWKPIMRRVNDAINQIHARRAAEMKQRPIQVQQAAVYEPELQDLMHRVLRPGDLFIDVGANVGKLTVLGADLVSPGGPNAPPTGRVIAVEPGANNLPALLAATEKMRSTVIIFPKAAWSKAGEMTFFECLDSGDANSVWNPADWPGPHNPKSKAENPPAKMIEAVTIDDLCVIAWDDDIKPTFRIPRLIKIDVEGAEQHVLEGAEKMLSAGVHYVVAELHEFGLQKLGHSQESLRGLMASHGYSTYIMHADGTLPMMVPEATKIETNLIFNLLFSTPQAIAEAWSKLNVFGAQQQQAPIAAYGATDGSSLKPNQPAKPFSIPQRTRGEELTRKLEQALGTATAAPPSIKIEPRIKTSPGGIPVDIKMGAPG